MGGRRTRRRAGEEVMADICSRSQGETGSDGEEEGGTVGRGEGAKRRPDLTQTENTERVIVGRGWGVIPVPGHITPYLLHANLVLFFCFLLFFYNGYNSSSGNWPLYQERCSIFSIKLCVTTNS